MACLVALRTKNMLSSGEKCQTGYRPFGMMRSCDTSETLAVQRLSSTGLS
jgi:hypothetical protein